MKSSLQWIVQYLFSKQKQDINSSEIPHQGIRSGVPQHGTLAGAPSRKYLHCSFYFFCPRPFSPRTYWGLRSSSLSSWNVADLQVNLWPLRVFRDLLFKHQECRIFIPPPRRLALYWVSRTAATAASWHLDSKQEFRILCWLSKQHRWLPFCHAAALPEGLPVITGPHWFPTRLTQVLSTPQLGSSPCSASPGCVRRYLCTTDHFSELCVSFLVAVLAP